MVTRSGRHGRAGLDAFEAVVVAGRVRGHDLSHAVGAPAPAEVGRRTERSRGSRQRRLTVVA